MYSNLAASTAAKTQMGHVLDVSKPSVSLGQLIEAQRSQRPVPASQKKLMKHRTPQEVAEYYRLLRLAQRDANPKGIEQDHANITLINDMHGFSDLNELDREGAMQIANALLLYPANAKKYRVFDGLTGFDVIEKNQSLETPKKCLSDATILKTCGVASTFLEWCKDLGYVKTNHFYRLRKKTNKKKNGERQPFTEDELSLIFNMSDYKNCHFLHPYYYWVPLLLRFTGARLNEVCQLLRADVRVVDGIKCFAFSDDGAEQRVKSVNANRVIPIHSALLKRGFWEFAKSDSSGRIFPELPLVKGYYSTNASKWFSRRRETLGLGRGKDAHSFRHSVINELKQKEVPPELITELVGHEQKTETMKTYSQQYRPLVLQKYVEMIDASHVAHIPPYSFK
ncbi:site-specific integrase [Vibrio sp. DNB22_19_1]